MRIAVIGIGQSMRGDDAAGLEAVRLWQRIHTRTACRPDVRVATIEAPGVDLLDLLDGADAAILVDATCSGAPAGTLHQVSEASIEDLRESNASAHAWGVAAVLQLRSALQPTLRRPAITLLGIEAAQTDFGQGLSRPVQSSLEAACETIEAHVTGLL